VNALTRARFHVPTPLVDVDRFVGVAETAGIEPAAGDPAHRLATGLARHLAQPLQVDVAEAVGIEPTPACDGTVFETAWHASHARTSEVVPAGIEPTSPVLHAGALRTELRNLGGSGTSRTCSAETRRLQRLGLSEAQPTQMRSATYAFAQPLVRNELRYENSLRLTAANRRVTQLHFS
jgi:hypothetical protein